MVIAFYITQTLLPAYAGNLPLTPAASAPAGQQPVLDAAQNGVPIVHIAPPSPGGVSRNQFDQFNVNSQGLILNNSNTATQTQLGGWISANPQLGPAPARVILNQVVSGNPSQLNGYMEVAGSRADVVVANPNGISCNGCGFINTGRASLVTGQPQFGADGSISGFDVRQGQISIGSAGLNATNVEQLDLIARGVDIQGDVWANKLNLLAGANQVQYASGQATAQSGTGVAPAFAVDIKNLGGMYANQIYLVATEQGLGVNSTGRLAALQGNLELNVNGDLSLNNSYAKQHLQLTSTGNTTLSGQTQSDGSTGLQSGGTLTQQGSLTAQDSLTLNASHLVNTGPMNSGAAMSLNALGNIDNSGTLNSGGQLALNAAGVNDTNGIVQGAGVNIQADSIHLSGTRLASSQDATLSANNGNVQLGTSQVSAAGNLLAYASGNLDNRTSQMAAGQGISVNAQALDNRDGTVSGAASASVITAAGINNQGGQILSNGNTQVAGNALDNSGGVISGQHSAVNLGQAAFINTSGQLLGAASLTLQSGAISNGQGSIATGGDLAIDTQGGALDNGAGSVQADGALTIHAAQINNAHGVIASNSSLGILSQAIDNSAGEIGAANTGALATGNLGIDTQGQTLTNTGGKLQAMGNATLNLGTTNNAGGVISAHDLNLNSGDFDNSHGVLLATGQLASLTGQLTNNGGLIQANGMAQLNTQGLDLININSGTSGGIIAGGALSLNGHSVNNQAGFIASNADISVLASNDVDNSHGGSVASNGNTSLNAANIYNNDGRITTLQNLSVQAGSALDNRSGKLIAGGTANLGAGSIDNSINPGSAGGGVSDANQLNISATNINNGNGTLRATQTAVINGALDNTSGLVSAQDTVTLNTPSLINSAGQVVATSKLYLTTASSDFGGILASQGDATLTIQGDYTNSGSVSALNTLSVSANNLTNNGALTAGGLLDVAATGNLLNSAGGELSATTNRLIVSGDVTNQGLIDGAATQVSANTLNNAGRLYGDDVTIQVATLNNNSNGTLAARNSLRVAATTVNNTDGALIYSAGPAAFASAFDTNGVALGNLSQLTNASATIEAQGQLDLFANQITNQKSLFSVQQQTTSNTPVSQTVFYCSGCGGNYERIKNGNINVSDTVITADSAPGQILSGADLNLNGSVVNDKSQIAAGGNIFYNNAAYTGISQQGQTIQSESGNVVDYYRTKCSWYQSCSWKNNYTINTPYSAGPAVTNTYNLAVASLTANGAISGTATHIQNLNVSPLGNQAAAIGLAAGNTRSLAAGNINAAIGLPATPNGPATPNHTVAAQTVLATLTVPGASLFHIHPQPGYPYLVETDPRFTSKQTFLSSDYYLSQLKLDPQLQQKRYGDGYAEQQLINDQVLALTGRRYLSGYSSTQDEFRSLMDAGVLFARQYQISPGVTLSAEQMALLTSDIVVLVKRPVTGPDGHTETVLVPQIFLRSPQANDLKADGSLIAASDINLRVLGDITNQGSIRADHGLSLEGQNVTNDGGSLRAQNIYIAANNDLKNLSGHLQADAALSLTAGRDIVIQTRTAALPVTLGNIAQRDTTVGRIATLQGDNLNLVAGRDLHISGGQLLAANDLTATAQGGITSASVAASHDITHSTGDHDAATTQTTTRISAGNDLKLAAQGALQLNGSDLQAGHDATLQGASIDMAAAANSQASTIQRAIKHGTTQRVREDEALAGGTLSAGNNLTLAALGTQPGSGDLTLTGARLNAAGQVNLSASHDLNLLAATTAHLAVDARTEHKSGLFSSSTHTTRDSVKETSAVASTVTGGSVSLNANNDINLQGSQVNAQNGVAAIAGNDINLSAAQNTRDESHYRYDQKSGLSTSGYHTDSRTVTDTLTQTTHTGSGLGTQSGNAALLANLNQSPDTNKGVIQMEGSRISAATGQVILNAKHIIVGASQDQSDSQHTTQQSQSNWAFNTGLPTGNQRQLKTVEQQTTQAASSLEGARGVALNAQGIIDIGTTHIAAAQGDISLSGAAINLHGGLDSHSSHSEETYKKTGVSLGDLSGFFTPGQGVGFKSTLTTDDIQTHVAPTTLDAQNIAIQSHAGDITLNAVQATAHGSADANGVQQPGTLSLDAAHNLNLTSLTTTTQHSVDLKKKDLAWQSVGGNGSIDQTTHTTQLNAAQLKLSAGNRISADMSVKASAAVLASEPGMGWIKQLQTDPALSNKIDWNKIEEAHQNWHYKQQGLTPAAAAVIAIVVAFLTSGAGAAAVNGVASTSATAAATAAGTTVAATYVTTTAVVQAAIASLASKAAVSLINNGGRLDATLKELGSSDNLKQLATSLVTAGLLSEIGQYNFGTTDHPFTLDSVTAKNSFAANVGKNLVTGLTRATITSAITGTDLETSIRTEVIASVLNAASAQGADWIGTQAQNNNLNAFSHAFAHAVAGCVAGAAGASASGSGISTGNGCGAGALGAAVGELSAGFYNSGREAAGLPPKTDTVAFASMVSGIAAALTGQSAQGVAIASGAGANAAQNNYLNHAEILALGASWKQCATSECKTKLLAQYRALSIQHDKELAACKTFDCVAGHLSAIREADSALATAYQVDPTGQLGMIVNNWQRQAQTVIAPVTVNQKNLIGSRKDSLVLYMNQFCRGMSSSACATQMLQNGKTTKILGELAYMAAMLTPAGTVDDAKSLLTGTDLTGQDSNRLLAVLGVVTAGEGTAIRKVVEEAGGLIKLAKTAVKDSPEAVKLTQELEAANKAGVPDFAKNLASHPGVDQVVEVSAGSKGNWDKAINGQLKAKTAYVLDNGHAYVTDASGRVSEVSGELSLTKMDRNSYQQGCAGKSGCIGDDGGHLIASSLGGAGDRVNIVPQAATLNRSDWKAMENYFRNQLAEGKQVTVRVDVGYPAGGGVRPSEFIVTATVDGKTMPRRIFNQ